MWSYQIFRCIFFENLSLLTDKRVDTLAFQDYPSNGSLQRYGDFKSDSESSSIRDLTNTHNSNSFKFFSLNSITERDIFFLVFKFDGTIRYGPF